MRGPDKRRRASRRGREIGEGEIDALLAQHPLPAPHEEPSEKQQWWFGGSFTLPRPLRLHPPLIEKNPALGSFTLPRRAAIRLWPPLIKKNPALVQEQLQHVMALLRFKGVAAAQRHAAEFLAPRVGAQSGAALLLRLWRRRHGNS
jgi:hypothetical protein